MVRTSFNLLWQSSPWTYNKNTLYENSDCWSRDTLNFHFLKKESETSISTTFFAWFFKQLFLVLYSINWPDFIVWLLLLFDITCNMFIVIVCYPVCDITNFEIYLNFITKPFSYTTKKSEQILKYLKNEKSF